MNDNLFQNCTLQALTKELALEISQWEYDSPYDAYSFKGRPNGYLLDASTWGTEQFCLIDQEKNAVVGQVACQFDGDDLWVGWSLHPALCAKGKGYLFIKKCVEEIKKVKGHSKKILLRVAVSNQRAVKAYQKAGFVHLQTVKDEIAYTNHTEDFLIMEYAGHRH